MKPYKLSIRLMTAISQYYIKWTWILLLAIIVNNNGKTNCAGKEVQHIHAKSYNHSCIDSKEKSETSHKFIMNIIKIAMNLCNWSKSSISFAFYTHFSFFLWPSLDHNSLTKQTKWQKWIYTVFFFLITASKTINSN